MEVIKEVLSLLWERLVHLLDGLIDWLEKRYLPEHVLRGWSYKGPLRKDADVPLHTRILNHNRDHILGVDGVALLGLVAAFLYFQQLDAIAVLFSTGDPERELGVPRLLWAGFPYAFQFSILLIAVLSIGVLIFALRCGRHSPRELIVMSALILSMLVGNLTYGLFEKWHITQEGDQTVLLVEGLLMQEKAALDRAQLDRARKLDIVIKRLLPQIDANATLLNERAEIMAYQAYLSGHKGGYERSIEEACKALMRAHEGQELSLAKEALHKSMYQLAHSESAQFAEGFVTSTASRFGGNCAIEASPFWLAIDPQLQDQFNNDPFTRGRPWWKRLPVDIGYEIPWEDYETEKQRLVALNQARFEQDMQYLEHLVVEYPQAKYRDLAFYFLGRYVEIIREYSDSDLLDTAYYAWAMEAFETKSYNDAVTRYEAFLYRYPEHDWRNDALWRIAKAHFALGDYDETLRYLTLAKNDPNSDDYLHQVDPSCDIAYIAEIVFDEESVLRYQQLNADPEVDLLLEFSLGVRYLAEDGSTRAREVFERIGREHPEINRFDCENMGWSQEEDLRFGIVCDSLEKLNMIDGFEASKHTIHDSIEFYLYNSNYYESGLWYPDCVRITEAEYTKDYLVSRDPCFRAGPFLDSLIHEVPVSERTRSLVRELSDYCGSIATYSAVEDPGTIAELHKVALTGYNWLLTQWPENSLEFDDVFEAVGGLYIERWIPGADWPWKYRAEDVEGLQREYTRLAQTYPNHRLANNALNWVAWSHCYLANLPVFGPDVLQPDWSEYESQYREALGVYYQLSVMNPFSAITRNAIEAIPAIEEKLSNPEKRVPVNSDRWGW